MNDKLILEIKGLKRSLGYVCDCLDIALRCSNKLDADFALTCASDTIKLVLSKYKLFDYAE